MKKWLSWMTAALLLFGSASAQTISPTTGLPIDGEPVAPMLVVISNTEANVEYNGHTTKAQGVDRLRRITGIQRIVCFGDNPNDLPMFAVADESYAVGNAKAEVKRAATGVIGSNEELGVVRYIMENAAREE